MSPHPRASVPPGWPQRVLPPAVDGWQSSASSWLLDHAPPEFRSYRVLRGHPVVLARFTYWHVVGALETARQGLSECRSTLIEQVDRSVVDAAVEVWLCEEARLVGLLREVQLVEQALRGRRFVPRL